MKFKDDEAQLEYQYMPTKLREIADRFEALSVGFGVTPVVSRVRKAVCGDSGVHEAGRGLDCRDQTTLPDGTDHRLYTQEQVDSIVQTLNSEFPRDDKFLVCIHHSFEGGPLHFHFQSEAKWGGPLPMPAPPPAT